MNGWTKTVIDKVNEEVNKGEYSKWTIMAFKSFESLESAFKGLVLSNVLKFYCNKEEIKKLIDFFTDLGMIKGNVIEESKVGIILFIKAN
jgi:hypothetical protein